MYAKNATKYQIGELNSVVQADESDIGGKRHWRKKKAESILSFFEKNSGMNLKFIVARNRHSVKDNKTILYVPEYQSK